MCYRTYTSDTSSEAEAVQLELIHRMQPSQRLAKGLSLSCEMIRLSKAAIRRRCPELSEDKVRNKFIEMHYSAELGRKTDKIGKGMACEEHGLNDKDDIVAALSPVVQAFCSLGVRYYIGGSVASSFHGATRSTLDVDVIAELNDEAITPFLDLLGDPYYASEPAIRDAVRRKSCFNLIHYPTSFKVDVFVSRDRPFDQDAMSRSVMGQIGSHASIDIFLASPEDTIISKLEWYKLGNETSERQWQDVSKVLMLLGEQADFSYLRHAAESVDVSDLLERLLRTNKRKQ